MSIRPDAITARNPTPPASCAVAGNPHLAHPGHIEDPDQFVLFVDVEGQQADTPEDALPEGRLVRVELMSVPRSRDQLGDAFDQSIECW